MKALNNVHDVATISEGAIAVPDFTVMISSTQLDMQAEREAVEQSVLGLDLRPLRAETLGTRSAPSREVVTEMARNCSLYVLILGARYGYIDPQSNVSVTELEFNEARADRPNKILVYRKGGVEMEPRQKAFAQRVEDFESGYFRRPPFASVDQLAAWVRQDIMAWLAEQATRTSAGGGTNGHDVAVAAVQGKRATWKPGFGQGPWVGMCLVPIGAKLPLTPYQLGDSIFQRKLRLLALQSEPELFNAGYGINLDADEQTVRLWQEQGHHNMVGEVTISLDDPITVRMSIDLPSHGNRDWMRSFYADPEAIHRTLTAAVTFSTNLYAQLGGALPTQAAVGAALGGMHMRSLAKPPVQSSGGVTIPTVDLPDPLLVPARPEVRGWLELSSKADMVAQQWVDLMSRAYARARRGG